MDESNGVPTIKQYDTYRIVADARQYFHVSRGCNIDGRCQLSRVERVSVESGSLMRAMMEISHSYHARKSLQDQVNETRIHQLCRTTTSILRSINACVGGASRNNLLLGMGTCLPHWDTDEADVKDEQRTRHTVGDSVAWSWQKNLSRRWTDKVNFFNAPGRLKFGVNSGTGAERTPDSRSLLSFIQGLVCVYMAKMSRDC